MIGFLNRFAKDRLGSPAMEFALVAPMMVFATLGAFDIVELMQANKRIENVAASISDVVSRDVLVTDDEIDDFFGAVDPLLHPVASAGFRMRVTSAVVQGARRAEVVWSDAQGMPAFTPGSRITVPNEVGSTQTGVIIVTVEHRWRSPLGVAAAGSRTITHTEYRRPRVVDPVLREGVRWDPR